MLDLELKIHVLSLTFAKSDTTAETIFRETVSLKCTLLNGLLLSEQLIMQPRTSNVDSPLADRRIVIAVFVSLGFDVRDYPVYKFK